MTTLIKIKRELDRAQSMGEVMRFIAFIANEHPELQEQCKVLGKDAEVHKNKAIDKALSFIRNTIILQDIN